MSTLRKHLLAIVSGLALAGLGVGTAAADVVEVTWNPNGSSPALAPLGTSMRNECVSSRSPNVGTFYTIPVLNSFSW